MFLLRVETNNAHSGAISAGLRRVYEADSARFSRISDDMGLNLTEILMLMVDE